MKSKMFYIEIFTDCETWVNLLNKNGKTTGYIDAKQFRKSTGLKLKPGEKVEARITTKKVRR